MSMGNKNIGESFLCNYNRHLFKVLQLRKRLFSVYVPGGSSFTEPLEDSCLYRFHPHHLFFVWSILTFLSGISSCRHDSSIYPSHVWSTVLNKTWCLMVQSSSQWMGNTNIPKVLWDLWLLLLTVSSHLTWSCWIILNRDISQYQSIPVNASLLLPGYVWLLFSVWNKSNCWWHLRLHELNVCLYL